MYNYLTSYFYYLGDRQRFTCDITTNPPTEHKVINTLLESFPGKMIWKIGNQPLQSSNEYEKVIILEYFCKNVHINGFIGR